MSLDLKDYCGIAGRALFKRPMFHFIFFVTSRCNLKCRMCFYWKELSGRNPDELSLEEIVRISKSMPGFIWLQLSGGEPFLRDDIDGICSCFARNNGVRYITIPTNGVLTGKILEKTEAIAAQNPGVNVNVSLSVNGIGTEHDEIAGVKGSFENLMKTAAALAGYRERFKNFALGVIVTQSKYNERNLIKTLAWIKSNIHCDDVSLNYPRGNPREAGCIDVDPALYFECSDWLKAQPGAGPVGWKRLPMGRVIGAKDMLMRDVIRRTIEKKCLQTECFAGRLSFVMSPSGDVFPCELLKDRIGNMRDLGYDFRRLLRQKELSRVISRIRDSGCYCTHECFLTISILFSNRFYLRALSSALKSSGR